MKYCQGTRCHTYKTKDRIRGHKGDKHYETRKNKSFYNGEFCSMMCRDDWFNTFGKRAVDHSAEYMSLKELVAMLLGINQLNGLVIQIIEQTMIITSLMIYLVNAYPLQNNNTTIL